MGTRVTFELQRAGDDTRLHFEHSGFDQDQPWGENALRGAEAGWTLMLVKIAKVAAAPDGPPAGCAAY